MTLMNNSGVTFRSESDFIEVVYLIQLEIRVGQLENIGWEEVVGAGDSRESHDGRHI